MIVSHGNLIVFDPPPFGKLPRAHVRRYDKVTEVKETREMQDRIQLPKQINKPELGRSHPSQPQLYLVAIAVKVQR